PAPRTNASTDGNSSSPSAHESIQSDPPSESRIFPSSVICRTAISFFEVEVVNGVLLFGIFLCNQWLHILQTLRNRRLHIPGSVLSVAPDAIEREILIDAPPSVVWPIVTEAQHLGGWFS